jgi:hypothetical protein
MSLQRFVIERDIPTVGSLDRLQLKEAATKSNGVLRRLAPDIQWVESYIAADRMFCVYLATDEAVIRQHAEMSGFPASRIVPILRKADPTTAQTRVAAVRETIPA